ncbi:restriction endonuclease subunit S [Streptococcus equi subsp. zooepidemicus]|uniref:Type I restriction modification DNA specificity protein n=3 Tax=Streptococcus equi TaxID=1336 RepID=C0MH49_STRS7|nr:restriction endonuclease subunit S [Streptococcus equi]MCD3388175.1 restriction endonuclease subunit S [Streptococcus equi subsp. zooepidemicus]MCD3399485.1 restriction endonuclease subunit S [Streptococcus equi subsp. zooepidemicus]MCD3451308.1 restriction endonuclease subunit S [Streptococcus equi subsp. zooepidemicus]MCD3465394.1 restriction endonuclease subunit S [Streptococcus equi subsp. zooepidemicus]CAW98328.1 type I restriction modification DNA specificity protein [Streptococcus eq
MRKMKDSGIDWIGEVPYNWRVVPIKSFLSKKKEILEKWTGENVLSLTMNGVVIRNLENPSGKMPTTFDGYQKIDKGSLILCLFDIDVTPRCVGIAYNDGVTSPAYSQYRIINGNLKFYYYLLLMMDNDKILLPYSRTLRSTLTDEYFGAVKVVIPPLSEQEKIAQFLDKKIALIDDIVTDTKTSIEELKAYKQSLITEIVTKGLDPTVKLVSSGIEWVGNVPEGWEVVKIKNISQLRNEKDIYETGQKFLALEKMLSYRPGYIDLLTEVEGGYQQVVKIDDVVFSKLRPYLAKVAISDFEGFGTGELLVFHNIKINRKLFMYKLISEQILQPVRSSSYGVKMPRVNPDFIMNLLISFPKSLYEQHIIADHLDQKTAQIDTLIVEKENLIREYETYKKSMIYEYVTGKKQVGANEG